MGFNELEILGALDDEMMGEDEMMGALAAANPELLGAAPGLARRLAARRTAGRAAIAQRFGLRAPGVPAQGARRLPLGFDSFTFVNAGVTINNFVTTPQVPFKGRRLVIDVARSAGALAQAVRIDDIQIGTRSQLAGQLRVSASVFGANAFDVDLGMDPCTPGTNILIVVSISAAPGVGETITVTPALIGDAVQ